MNESNDSIVANGSTSDTILQSENMTSRRRSRAERRREQSSAKAVVLYEGDRDDMDVRMKMEDGANDTSADVNETPIVQSGGVPSTVSCEYVDVEADPLLSMLKYSVELTEQVVLHLVFVIKHDLFLVVCDFYSMHSMGFTSKC